MQIPFSIEQFLTIFKTYNLSIWPMQWIAYLLGTVAVLFTIVKVNRSSQIISGILSLLWIWNGAAYHIGFFSKINKSAYLFGSLFIIQGLLFFWFGVIKKGLNFRTKMEPASVIGWIFIAYSMGVYPVLNYLFGHVYPQMPMFGLAPCPTVIFTYGLLLMRSNNYPKHLLIIPIIWSVIGISAAVNLKIYADYGLFAAGLLGTGILLFRSTIIAGRPFKSRR